MASDYGTRSWRAREQLRRLLTIIDMMAAQRNPWTLVDLAGLLPDRVHMRTLYRDITLLESMHLVDCVGTAPGTRDRQKLWVINMQRTERLQEAAMVLDD